MNESTHVRAKRGLHLLSLGLALAGAAVTLVAHAAWTGAGVGLRHAVLDTRPLGLAVHPALGVAVVANEESNSVQLVGVENGDVSVTIPVGRSPKEVALDAPRSAAYVLHETGRISRIDLGSAAKTAEWEVGHQAKALLVTADGSELIVAAKYPSRLVRVSTTDGVVVASIPLPSVPNAVTLNPDGSQLYVATENGGIRVFSTPSWSELGSIDLNDVESLSYWSEGSRLIGADRRKVYVVNPATSGVESIAAGTGLRRLAVSGASGVAYLTDRDTNAVAAVDLNARTYRGRFLLADEPYHAAVTPNGHVLVTLSKANKLLDLDPALAVLAPSVFLGEKLKDIVVDNGADRALAVTEKERAYVINLIDKHAEQVTLPAEASAIAIDAARSQALLGFNARHDLRFLDLATREFFPEVVDLNWRPEAIAVDESRGLALVAVDFKDKLLILDTKTRTVLKTLSVQGRYKDAAVHSGKGLAYVVNRDKNSGELLVVDLVNQTLAGTIPISKQAEAIVVDEALDLAVLAVERRNKVEVIDLNTGEVVHTHALSRHPQALALNTDTHVVAIAAKDSDQIALLDLTTQALTPNFANVDKPKRISITERYNQALVIAAEKQEILFVQLPNSVPVLTEIVPPDVTAPAPAVALLAVGKHFIDGSKVYLDDQPLPTRWKDNSHLEADVPVAVLGSAGIYSVKVVTPGPGGGASQSLSFTVQNPVPAITAISPVEVVEGSPGQALAVVGNRFVATSVVRFGVQDLSTTFVDSEHLTAVIPAALLVSPGPVPVTVFNPIPGGGSSNPVTLNVTPSGPRITGVEPASGEAGTLISIYGSGFEPVATKNQVVFTGDIAATVQAASTTELRLAVPPGARSGPITVTTAKGEAQSPVFTVLLEQDFALVAMPSQATLVQNSETTFSIQLSSLGTKPFTGLVRLSAHGLPDGIIARFNPSAITANQTVALTVKSQGATPVQTLTLDILGELTTGGVRLTRTVAANVTVVQGGQTGVKGRFVTPEGQGIAGVYVRVDDVETTSDAAGNFLLTGLPAGVVTLRFDATPANPLYPIWPYQTETKAGEITELADWTINAPPPTENFTAINNATQTQRITDPRFPGLEITLPAGVTITGWDGVVKTRLAVERIEADKLPVPPPPVPIKEAYQLYFGTPMGGIPSAPIPVSVPNVTGLEPGQKTEIWYFDGSPMGGSGEWKVAGPATVSADGTTLVSDPGAGIPRFCGVCGLYAAHCPPLPSGDPPSPEPCKDGNPIELLSGYEMPNYGGLRCGGVVPREIGLSYHPVDGFQGRSGLEGAIGHGWVLDYDIVLADSNQVPQSKRLILPPNNRINFNLQSDGTYTAAGDPRFRGAVLRLTSSSPRTWELTFKDGRKWRFGLSDSVGLTASFLIEQVDPQGNVTQVQRRSDRKITAIGDDSRSYQFTYGANNLVEEIRDPANRTIRFTYNANRRIETMTAPDGGVTRYTYVGDDEFPANSLCPQGTDGLRIKTIHYPGKPNPTVNEHGPSRRVLRQVSAGGVETKFEYQLTGACVVHESNPAVRCTGPECPTVDSWENYQAGWRIFGGQVVATTTADANGRRTRNFNAAGVVNESTDAHGARTRFVRDAQNRVVQRIDALGRETRYFYDNNGNVTREIRDANGLNQITDYEYDPNWNKPTVITRYRDDGSPLVISRQTYDVTTGNLTSVTDANARTWTYTYNPRGQVASVVAPNQTTTALSYNDTGDLTAITDPLGNVSRFAPDSIGRTVETIDALGYRTMFNLNVRDQQEQVTDAVQGTVKLEYDIRGNLIKVTNQNNQVIQQNAYDDADRLLTRTDGAGLSETFTYDGAGNLETYTDRKGQTMVYVYDSVNRLIEVRYADGTSETRTYDSVGRLSSMAGPQGTVSFQYDSLDRLVQVTTPEGFVRYSYDALDRRTRMETPQQVTTYGYDDQGNLTTIAQGSDVTTIEYDENNRRSRLNYPSGIVAAYVYDDASRLTSLTYQFGAVTVESLIYEYDPNGNVILRTRTAAGSKQEAAKEAVYDPATNRLMSLINGAGNSETFGYDDNGNLTTYTDVCGTTTYTWNTKNQLIGTNGFRPDCSELTASFSYDPLGRRTQRTVNGETTTYIYDGLDVIAELGSVSTTYLRTGKIDEAVARYTSDRERYLLTDLLGSVLLSTDGTGAPSTVYRYSPFGDTEAAGEASSSPVQYTGRENDGAKLYYYRARYYAPDIARFISEDPIELQGGLNLYAYVRDNPVNRKDPLGLFDDFLFSIEQEIYINKTVGQQGQQFLTGYFPALYGADALVVGGGLLAAAAPAACTACLSHPYLCNEVLGAIGSGVLGALGGTKEPSNAATLKELILEKGAETATEIILQRR